MRGFISTVVFAVVLISAEASKAQIGPGAVIPLDLSKPRTADQIAATLNSCLLRETLFSLMGLSPNSTLSSDVFANTEGDETGTATAWTKTMVWLPYSSHKMNFEEWPTPTTSVSRQLTLNLDTQKSYTNLEYQQITANFVANPEGKSVSVELSLDIAFPHYKIESTGGAPSCSVNNWGRDTCQAVDEKITSANLVIPNDFVYTSYWTNAFTGHETAKQFDTYKYAECLLNNW